jgi:hypothetical protein
MSRSISARLIGGFSELRIVSKEARPPTAKRFSSHAIVLRQAQGPSRSNRNRHHDPPPSQRVDKVMETPIAWTTGTNALSDEMRAFLADQDVVDHKGLEIVPDDEIDGMSRMEQFKVRQGVVVECRRCVG